MTAVSAEPGPLATMGDRQFRDVVEQHVRAQLQQLETLAAVAEAELARLRNEAKRLRDWLARRQLQPQSPPTFLRDDLAA